MNPLVRFTHKERTVKNYTVNDALKAAEYEKMQNEIHVSAVQKEKDDFPMIPALFLSGALVFGMLYNLAR